MKLQHLVNKLEVFYKDISDLENIIVKGIADSSLSVKKDFVFVAINGFNLNGHKYIKDAVSNGACVIIGEEDITDSPVPYIKVKNSRKTLGTIAKIFHGNPSKGKLMIGITGTNGKTTTSYLLKHILETNGLSCSMIGTVQNVINGEILHDMNTTPSSLSLQELLSKSKDEVVIIEVSSHGLTQDRVEGLEFDFCLFTNLTHDHLDYHESMEEYFMAKALLFDKLKESGLAVVNTDDFWGKKMADMLKYKGKKGPYTIGQSKGSHVRILDYNFANSTLTVEENNKLSYILSPMFGMHNMYNIAMAYVTATRLNIGKDDVLASIYKFAGVDGRFEILPQNNGATVVIDYAHTPDAISHCLKTAKLCGAKRLIHVFGFRGDRDPTKRQEMIEITSELSDQYILTLDDLNTVSHKEMIETLENLNNTFGNENGLVVSDRTLALEQALKRSTQGDWIVVTGKGHEKYQQKYYLPTGSDGETITYFANQQSKSELLN
ncbi:UDP-N-acetylmuramoyl-L-alanyl-D-glutamate--2,6-diaminopimelate ligase [Virgibacillus salexigens]|uniref:UDP-N-acetylmuramoyl-L-alanyl-D-glutamate--2, 6-diaminopimelate ligase n=1 Tax=Virgibacillus salexigens TaxID=61016 RepID=UPI0019092493|nr:UDP-N-acetylmuramoyl-L-alanyl-D-glutamate--2,6-diaminopimelate ligase [Virgibacillus salexigens]